MPAPNRSARRNVHIFDAQEPEGIALGGLILTNGVTNKNLHAMINIIVIIHGPYVLRHDSDTIVPEDDSPVQPGKYYLVTAARIEVNNEKPLLRALSNATGTRHQTFRDAVRSRDQQCVITGRQPVDPDNGDWRPLQAAHIYPLAYHQQWIEGNLGRWITKLPAKGEDINSVQNGLLLDAGMHLLFDGYTVSINPEDRYKIVFFNRDTYQVAGNYLQPEFLNHPDRPVDELFRWHFRQAVLTNMKGAGEPVFESDFPPGADMINDILSGPMAAERMEFELFSRLASVQDV
ncbi:MAG: hypothetical protein M1830_004548 [Pleopsidium flavum]|nr:MAG: hypothetical protein M1830_004548 [Pleopsidium flavum]